MATLTNTVAQWALSTSYTRTAVNATSSSTVGETLSRQEWSDADVFYSFTVTATGALDVATLTPASGAIAKTTGTPDVTRWSGQTGDTAAEDLEGLTIGTIATLYGILFDVPSTSSGTVAVDTAETAGYPETSGMGNGILSVTHRAGLAISGGDTLTMTFSAIGGTITGTVIGKTT